MIRVVVVDDHALVRAGLYAIVDRETDMQVVGEAGDAASAAERVQALRPDVVLLDMVIPGGGGLAALEAIERLATGARVLVLTSYLDGAQIVAALKAGALGYFLKDAAPADLVRAIRDVHGGSSSIHPAVARELILEVGRAEAPAGTNLSRREMDVLRVLADGMSNEEIARSLSISARTVGRHVGSILEKLQVANRTQAVLRAQRLGLTRSDG